MKAKKIIPVTRGEQDRYELKLQAYVDAELPAEARDQVLRAAKNSAAIRAKLTEIETIKTNKGEADGLWDPDQLVGNPLSPFLTLAIPVASRDSYYQLIASAESYWRAFQTNGTDAYHPADLSPDAERYENGFHTTGHLENGTFRSAREGFDQGAFIGRGDRVMFKLIVDADSRRVLGCHIVAPNAGELIQLAGIAVKMGATKEDFDRTVAVHPTISEELVTMRTPVRSA